MADENRLKSSFELAMERLRQKDAEAGVTTRALTDADKAAIAEIRSFYEAKIAEQQVMHQSRLQRLADPAQREALEADLRSERERFIAERDRKIEKIRNPTREPTQLARQSRRSRHEAFSTRYRADLCGDVGERGGARATAHTSQSTTVSSPEPRSLTLSSHLVRRPVSRRRPRTPQPCNPGL